MIRWRTCTQIAAGFLGMQLGALLWPVHLPHWTVGLFMVVGTFIGVWLASRVRWG